MFYKNLNHLLIFLVFLFISTESAAEIYKWTDDKGKVHFSDKEPRHQKSSEVRLKINTYESVNYDTSIFDTGKKVIMYSTSWCAYCKKAKRYFKRKGIPFTEYNIENNMTAKRQYKKMGATGVPVILVGNKRMNGFSEKGFERIYN
jgi:glutaredoxin